MGYFAWTCAISILPSLAARWSYSSFLDASFAIQPVPSLR